MKTFLLASLLCGSTVYAQEARPETEWDKKLVPIANKEGIPALLLAAVCWAESSHRPSMTHHDDGGSSSIGLCQIKLDTAQWMGYGGTVEGLYKPETNAKYAAKFIKYQLERYDNQWDDAIAAYNAGSVLHKKDDPKQYVNQSYVDKVKASILK